MVHIHINVNMMGACFVKIKLFKQKEAALYVMHTFEVFNRTWTIRIQMSQHAVDKTTIETRPSEI